MVLEASGEAVAPARAAISLTHALPVSESSGQETSESDDAVSAVDPVVVPAVVPAIVPERPRLERLLCTLETRKKKPARFKPRRAQSAKLEPTTPKYMRDQVLMPLSAVLHPSLSSHFPDHSTPFSLDAPADVWTTEEAEMPGKNGPKLLTADDDDDDDGWSRCCRHLCCVPIYSGEADSAGG